MFGGKSFQKLVGLTLCWLCVFLSACQSPDSEAIRFGLDTEPANLDPRFATDAVSARLLRLVFRQLVRFNEAFEVEPDLARWHVLTGLHYRFTLGRQGRLFHDGSRLQAADVKATFDFILNQANQSPLRAGLESIERIVVIDADTVDFYLGEVDPFFTARLAIGIVKDGGGHGSLIGSGPMRMLPHKQLGITVLQRIRDAQRFEFVTVKDPVVRVLKLLHGEIDMLQNGLTPELIRFVRFQHGLYVKVRPGVNFTYLGINLRDPMLANLAVRKAIAFGIDRDAILTFIWAGGASAANTLLPPGHWAAADLPGYTFDPEIARRYLKQAGYGPEKPLMLIYKTSSNPFRIRLATVLQHQLNAVGFDIRLQSYDWATFYADIKSGRFQLFSLSWVGVKSPDMYRHVFHSASVPPNGFNRGRYHNPLADSLIESGLTSLDRDTQIQSLLQLQRILLDDLPYIPLWYENHVAVMRDGISAYRLAADGNYDGLQYVEKTRKFHEPHD